MGAEIVPTEKEVVASLARQCERAAVKLRALAERNEAMARNNMLVMCSFCGETMRRDEPDALEQLKTHMVNCPRHPVHTALIGIQALRSACRDALELLAEIGCQDAAEHRRLHFWYGHGGRGFELMARLQGLLRVDEQPRRNGVAAGK